MCYTSIAIVTCSNYKDKCPNDGCSSGCCTYWLGNTNCKNYCLTYPTCDASYDISSLCPTLVAMAV